MRTISPDESTILIISPKFATVHDHVSFQWSVKIHGTSGLKDEEGEEEGTQCDYVAVELYLVDGPVSQVNQAYFWAIIVRPFHVLHLIWHFFSYIIYLLSE